MTREAFLEMAEKGPVILDGATGSCLREMGMPVAGVCTEQWVYDHPEVIEKLQREYVDAGAQILYAPTFGANRISLRNMGLENQLENFNRVLVKRTISNVGDRVLVAGDLSTTGQPMEPNGPMTYHELMDIYQEQIQLLSESGAELLVAETLLSQEEAVVICDAARSVCKIPLIISFTCEGDGNLYFGGSVFEAAKTLEAMGVDAVGVNCSVGPDQLDAVIRGLRKSVSIPIVAKPNAGMPKITETGQAVYNMGPEDFARHVWHLHQCGASLIGGCCGTTPEYIGVLRNFVEELTKP